MGKDVLGKITREGERIYLKKLLREDRICPRIQLVMLAVQVNHSPGLFCIVFFPSAIECVGVYVSYCAV